jgi:hypothetical protein
MLLTVAVILALMGALGTSSHNDEVRAPPLVLAIIVADPRHSGATSNDVGRQGGGSSGWAGCGAAGGRRLATSARYSIVSRDVFSMIPVAMA